MRRPRGTPPISRGGGASAISSIEAYGVKEVRHELIMLPYYSVFDNDCHNQHKR